MIKLLYPEILEALEDKTVPVNDLEGVVNWIANEIGLTEIEICVMFYFEILTFLGANYYEPGKAYPIAQG